jgi:DNA (cytosine-5)-methyltransferase 1
MNAKTTNGLKRVRDGAPSVVDLFCGAGGLTASLEAVGWQTVAAVDSDSDSMQTLFTAQQSAMVIPGQLTRRYLEGTRLLHRDVRQVTRRDLIPEGVSKKWRPDLLVGGPPCQPFSSAGRRQGLDDPRGRLFLEFVRLAQELKPRFILFENVAGLVTAKCSYGEPGGVLRLIQRSFEDIGYACRFDLLNAADYGAAQRRVRLFMLASLAEPIPDFPLRSHSRDIAKGVAPWRTLGEFLANQREPSPEDVVRPTPGRADALAALKPGTGIRSTGIVEANRPGGHWGYRQDCFLADLTVPSRTIRAASTPDWVQLPGQELRRLTWKECASLQGFPALWPFAGTASARFRQIGNAVQGDVGRALGRAILECALKKRTALPKSHPWPDAFHRRVRYTRMEAETNGLHRQLARTEGTPVRQHAGQHAAEMV